MENQDEGCALGFSSSAEGSSWQDLAEIVCTPNVAQGTALKVLASCKHARSLGQWERVWGNL